MITMMNEEEWQYLAEGKLHVVLKYQVRCPYTVTVDDDCVIKSLFLLSQGSNPIYHHHVLRALKVSKQS